MQYLSIAIHSPSSEKVSACMLAGLIVLLFYYNRNSLGWSPGHCWFSTTTIGPCIARELTIWTISSHTSTESVKIAV